MITKPNIDIFFAGFPKCGTSLIAKFLEEDGRIGMSRPKEPGFFKTNRFCSTMSWQDYYKCFEHTEPDQLLCDATVNYCCSYPNFLADPEVIYTAFPDAKVVFLLRDPIERFRSHWLHHSVIGHPRDLPSFEKAATHNSMFLNTSRYWNHVSRWRRVYSDDQIYICTLEHFKRDPVSFQKQLLGFLGFDDLREPWSPVRRENVTDTKFIDGGIARFLRLLPGSVALQRRLPAFTQKLFRHLFRRGVGSVAEFTPEVLRFIRAELIADADLVVEYGNLRREDWGTLYSSGHFSDESSEFSAPDVCRNSKGR